MLVDEKVLPNKNTPALVNREISAEKNILAPVDREITLANEDTLVRAAMVEVFARIFCLVFFLGYYFISFNLFNI